MREGGQRPRRVEHLQTRELTLTVEVCSKGAPAKNRPMRVPHNKANDREEKVMATRCLPTGSIERLP